MTTKQIQYNNEYNKKYYDQIPIRVKKGFKQVIQNYAERNNMSANEYITTAIQKYNNQQQAEMIHNLKEKITPIAKKYKVDKIILYGSRARGDYHKNSDYDLFVNAGNINGLIELLQFKEEIENVIKSKTDITTANEDELDEYMLKEIKKDGIKVYERK